MSKIVIVLLICGSYISTYGEEKILNHTDSIPKSGAIKKINWIAPVALFSTGSAIAAIPTFRKIDTVIKNGFNSSRNYTKLDDYTQYVPGVAVFVLDAVGIKGKTNPKHQLVLYGLSNITAGLVIQSMKQIVHRERPYGNVFNAFPSGHTGTAFAAAEFLHQEFGHYSPWISVAGYTTATATGYLRLYNNKHWLADVLAGAAIGMASTKFIYWINNKKRAKQSRQKLM